MHRLRLGLCLALLLTLVSVSIHAQDTSPRYRLRVPSVEEYLTAIPAVLAQWGEDVPDDYHKNYSQPLVDAVAGQMWRWYTSDEVYQQPYALLRDVYTAFIKATIYNLYQTPLDDQSWLLAQLDAYLRETPLDLEGTETLNTEGFSAAVHPVDFDGEGQDEYWLEYASAEWGADVILQADPSRIGHYQVASTHHWRDTRIYSYARYPREIQDITGDGASEWILVLASGHPVMFVDCVQLEILTWQDGGLQSVMPAMSDGCHYGGEFDLQPQYLNLDSDAALEIYYDESQRNTWDCDEVMRYTLDWNGENYHIIRHETITLDSLGCSLRDAESLMWEGRYQEAIPLYEHGLQVGWPEGSDSAESTTETPQQLADYAQIRLILAYALTGQMDTALQRLDAVSSTPSTSQALNDMVEGLLAADRQGLAWCMAAYNYWAEIERSTFQYPGELLSPRVGRHDTVRGVTDDTPPDANKAGCDAPRLIDALLSAHTFTLDTPPLEQFESLGIAVHAARSFDLNGEGDEWLIWPVALVNPILLVPRETSYLFSRPAIRREDDYTQIFTQALPDEQGTVIVDWAYLDFEPNNLELYRYDIRDDACEQKEQGKYQKTDGDVRLWRLEDGALVKLFAAPMCTKRMPDVLFTGNGHELHAASPIDRTYRDAVYQWDSHKKTYVPPYISAPEETQGQLSHSPLLDGDLFNAFTLMQSNDYQQGDYTAALTSLDNLIAGASPDAHHVIVNALHYWRGMTLEALNRPDEALAAYVAIIEAAPESAWGRLAALYVEVIDE